MSLSNSDLSEIWYQECSDGSIKYSRLGLTTYRALFEKVGIDIADITTVEEHRIAVKKALAVPGERKKS